MGNLENSKFQLIPVVKTPNVSPGGEVKIGFFVTGSGPPKKSKIYINLASFDLKENPLKFKKNIVSRWENDGKNLMVATGEENSVETEISSESGKSFSLSIPAGIFLPKSEDTRPHDYSPIHGEMKYGEAPLLLSFEIDENINPGNYEIRSALTYGNDEEVEETNINTNTVHVMNWYERNRKGLVTASIVLGTLSLIATLLTL